MAVKVKLNASTAIKPWHLLLQLEAYFGQQNMTGVVKCEIIVIELRFYQGLYGPFLYMFYEHTHVYRDQI